MVGDGGHHGGEEEVVVVVVVDICRGWRTRDVAGRCREQGREGGQRCGCAGKQAKGRHGTKFSSLTLDEI